MSQRFLLCGGGAPFSLWDVETGYRDGLREGGHEVIHFPLDSKIDSAAGWLAYNWRKARKINPAIERPSQASIVYLANHGIVERALREQVDWVIAISGMWLHPDILILLRRAHIKTALLFTESPYADAQQARIASLVDVCWTTERTSVPLLRRANPSTYCLPHCYDPARHAPGSHDGDDEVPAHDVVFVGTGFPERVELLRAVDWTGIDLGLYGAWMQLGSRNPLRQFVQGKFINNATAAALYRRAKIGLNLYRTRVDGPSGLHIVGAESLNPRAVELAACGVFSISEYRAEVPEMFGDLVPTFKTADELSTLLRLWLPQREQRAMVAERLPGTVRRRTFAEGAARMVGHLGLQYVTRREGGDESDDAGTARHVDPSHQRHADGVGNLSSAPAVPHSHAQGVART